MAEGFRLRVCFRKAGRLRHLSHLETMRACERAARRAGLPYAVSQGFTPRMKMAFGPALPVGTAGEREYYDLMLASFVPPDEACRSLEGVSAVEIAPHLCGYVPVKERSLGAALTIAAYDVTVEGGIPHEEIGRALARIVETGTLGIDHKGKHKVFDLTEALPKEPDVTTQDGQPVARIWVRMGERGSIRPEALIDAALGAHARTIVTRTDLFIEDKGVWRRPL
ncbi:MAG: TIGR03936 family radical SAM-associated protein [Coriobacteriia bacterium]|nr:TIGR03936 family radical SAM-associated protein [Coriobacteriia bacterium]